MRIARTLSRVIVALGVAVPAEAGAQGVGQPSVSAPIDLDPAAISSQRRQAADDPIRPYGSVAPSSDRLESQFPKLERTAQLSVDFADSRWWDTVMSWQAAKRENAIEQGIGAYGLDAATAGVISQLEKMAAPTERADLSLTYANTLLRTGEKTGNDELLNEALGFYRDAWRLGDDRTNLIARSNFAATAYKLGDKSAALQAFSEGHAEAKPDGDQAVQSRYLFNYARLLEEVEGQDKALPLYLESFKTDATSARPAVLGIKAAKESGRLEETARFLDGLSANGHANVAASEFRSILLDQGLDADTPIGPVLDALFDYFARARLTVADFDDSWRPLLRNVASAVSEQGQGRITLMFQGYKPGAMELFTDPIAARERYAPWLSDPFNSKLAARVLGPASRFLTTAGEVLAAGESAGDRDASFPYEDAVTRYLTAWMLDTSNVDAAQYAGNLLLLTGRQDQLDAFVAALFEGKSMAYVGEAWPSIFRFHSILGLIYWQQEYWGSSSEVRSAIFQLERALAARDKIEDSEVREASVARLHLMLGDAYAATRPAGEAFESYARAMRDGIAHNDLETAGAALERARALRYAPTPAEADFLNKIEGQL